MFRKLNHIIVLLCLATSYVSAQDVYSLEWGPLLDEQKGNDLVALFGADSSHFYTLRYTSRKKGGYIVEKIDTDSMYVQQTEDVLLPSVGSSELLLQYPIELGDDIYFIATTDNELTGEINIYAIKLLPSLKFDLAAILLGIGTRATLMKGLPFNLFKDKTSEHLMVVVPRETEMQRNAKYNVALFDSGLRLVHENLIEIPHISGLISLDDALIQGDSSLYFIFSKTDLNLSDLESDRKMGRNHFVIEYDWETGKLREKSLSLGTKWLYDVHLVLNADSNVQVAGYYSNMVDLSIAGTFSIEQDHRTGQIINQGLSPLDRDFKAQFKRATNNDPPDLGLFGPARVYATPHGFVNLVSEKEYAENTTVFNPVTGTYSLIRIQNYDQIIVTGMAPSSQIAYSVSIPKFQSTTRADALYTSFLSYQGTDNLYLIYNDHERNAGVSLSDPTNHRQITSTANTMATIVRIDKDGRSLKLPLFYSSDANMTFTPYFYRTLPDGVIITAVNGYKTQFLRLKLK
jgi:hypothetical protein